MSILVEVDIWLTHPSRRLIQFFGCTIVKSTESSPCGRLSTRECMSLLDLIGRVCCLVKFTDKKVPLFTRGIETLRLRISRSIRLWNHSGNLRVTSRLRPILNPLPRMAIPTLKLRPLDLFLPTNSPKPSTIPSNGSTVMQVSFLRSGFSGRNPHVLHKLPRSLSNMLSLR